MTKTSHARAGGGRPSTNHDASRWSGAALVAFRFGVVYLALFALATQISGSLIANPFFAYRGLGRLWPMRETTHWVARTFFGVDVPLDDVSGGETVFFWIQTAWLVVFSVIVTGAWSALDRRRAGYDRLVPWVRLAIRLALAASLLEYGVTKIIPTQFPPPPLTALVTPVGDMTPSALLWTTIGSSPAYEIFTGCIEALAGVLLLVPRTATLGAVLGLIALTQVLALNMAFDIGVKLVTMHLIAMAVILLAPDAPRIAAVLAPAPRERALPPRPPANSAFDGRFAVGLQLAFALYLLSTLAWINWSFWQTSGGGQPRSALYGIWNVEQLAVDGELRPAQLNDYDRRWRRVIFDTVDTVAFQRTDDSFVRYGISVDSASGTLALTKGGSRTWSSRFTYDRPSPDRMTLAGEMDGQRIEAQLRRLDSAAFPLLNGGFRWVRPHDP